MEWGVWKEFESDQRVPRKTSYSYASDSRETFFVHISTTTNSLGALLAQLDDIGKERAIYYISRTLVSYELNYASIEKYYLVVVFASQKLKHYMLAHTM